MPIDLLALAADLIAGEGLELVKDKVKRQEGVLRVLSKLGFKLDSPPTNDFDGVYAYTLVVYGIDKPKPILEFFRHGYIKNAFRKMPPWWPAMCSVLTPRKTICALFGR